MTQRHGPCKSGHRLAIRRALVEQLPAMFQTFRPRPARLELAHARPSLRSQRARGRPTETASGPLPQPIISPLIKPNPAHTHSLRLLLVRKVPRASRKVIGSRSLILAIDQKLVYTCPTRSLESSKVVKSLWRPECAHFVQNQQLP